MKPAILIAGPTAQRQVRLAIRVARAVGRAWVLNAESMQVYRDLRIITARPSPEEEASVEHRLFRACGRCCELFLSASGWRTPPPRSAMFRRPADAVLVGGTGMYFKALTQGLSDIPRVPEEVRARVRGETEGMAPQADSRRPLAACDPLTASRLRPTIRSATCALWKFSRPPASRCELSRRPAGPAAGAGLMRAVYIWRRTARSFNRRIDARFDAMMEAGRSGGSEACRAGLDRRCPAMRALTRPG